METENFANRFIFFCTRTERMKRIFAVPASCLGFCRSDLRLFILGFGNSMSGSAVPVSDLAVVSRTRNARVTRAERAIRARGSVAPRPRRDGQVLFGNKKVGFGNQESGRGGRRGGSCYCTGGRCSCIRCLYSSMRGRYSSMRGRYSSMRGRASSMRGRASSICCR